jgi:formamidopyrimidine-DNA glycosylase
MPESPEVQAFAESIGARATGRVAHLKIFDHRADKTRQIAPSTVSGQAIMRVGRRGKYIDIQTSGPPSCSVSLASSSGTPFVRELMDVKDFVGRRFH